MPAPSDPTSVSITRRGSQIVTATGALQYLFAGFDFAWAVVAAVRYRVRWDQGPPNGELLGLGVGSRRFTGLQISSAYPAHVFGLQVRAENDSGVSAWVPATPVDFIAPSSGTGTAATPGGLASSSVKPRSFALSWTSSDTNVSYFECRVAGVTTTQNFVLALASLERSAVITGLLPAQTYLVSMRAVVGLGTSAGLSGLAYSAWSADITVITLADAIQIIAPSGGAVMPVWRTITYNTGAPAFAVATSTAATVRSASGLPGTLAIVGSTPGSAFTIEGNVTAAAVGLYTATINVTDVGANTDALTVGVLVRAPSIAIAPAPLSGVAGTALSYTVPWSKSGPIASPGTWALRFAPAFLAIDSAGIITGTPDTAGLYAFEVSASNGTQLDVQPMTLNVTGLAITSAAEVSVYQGDVLDFALTANAAGVTWSALNLPTWLTLTGSHLTGRATPAPQDYAIQITAVNASGDTATQAFTVHLLSLFQSETAWDLYLGQQAFKAVRFNGAGTVEAWFISDAPPGLTLATIGTSGANHRQAVTGAPSATGIYDLTLTVRVLVGLETFLYSTTIPTTVTGALFLGWFHDDPMRRDLQLMMRSEVVTSYYLRDGALSLVRGDHVRLYVIPRDAPIHAEELGRRLVLDGFSKIWFNVSRKDDFDAEPFLELGGTVTTEVIGGNTIFLLEFDVTSDAIESAFEALNRARGGASVSTHLEAIGEVTIIRNDTPATFRGINVNILQDYNTAGLDITAPPDFSQESLLWDNTFVTFTD